MEFLEAIEQIKTAGSLGFAPEVEHFEAFAHLNFGHVITQVVYRASQTLPKMHF